MKHALLYDSYLWGKAEFLTACGIPWHLRPSTRDLETALVKIRNGSWLFLTDTPFKPMRINGCLGENHCFRVSGGAPEQEKIEQGPGKWLTIDIDYNGLKNTFTILQNRLGSLGDEGRLFGSEGKDYGNTSRIVTQQWVPLDSNDDHLASRSAIHAYGKLRAVTQRYFEGEDKWQISGKSWHWQPVLPHETYESREK